MDRSPEKPSSLFRILRWFGLAVVLVYFALPRLLMWWPPDWIDRHDQRRVLYERVQSAGGWDALKRDCAKLVDENRDGLRWSRGSRDYKPPAAIAALKPKEIVYYPPGSVKGTAFDTAVPVVRIRIFGLPSTGGHAAPYLGLHVVCSTNAAAYEPPRGSGEGAPGNRYTTFRKVAENVFEIY